MKIEIFFPRCPCQCKPNYFVTLLSYHCAALDWLQKLYDERHATLLSRIYQPRHSKPLGNENFNTKTNNELER